MRVLIACEFSGTVRDAFAARGHDAWSCDILPTEKPGQHYHCDVREVIYKYWDLVIAHPPCTYLTNSGVRWLYKKGTREKDEGRWRSMFDASHFFRIFTDYPGVVCVENPIPHCYASLPKYTQLIQPWQFGHGETKATCLWLKGLPELKPTNIVEGRKGAVWLMGPSPERQKNRSRTYPGIAEAMADQWNEDALSLFKNKVA